MNVFGDVIGELCKIVLPIPEEYYVGNPASSVAICTLSSMDLLKKFAKPELLDKLSIVGRLLSENKGIDSIVDYVSKHRKVTTIVVCGQEVWGHKAGHSLFSLHKNGIDKNNRIIGSTSPDPYLTVSQSKIQYFQKNVTLVNLIDETDFEKVLDTLKSI